MNERTTAIAGRSNQNISSALDSIPQLHVRFQPNNDEQYVIINDSQSIRPRKLMSKASTFDEYERQFSMGATTADQFQAARDGYVDQLKALFRENESNHKLFFNQLDPETKLTALHYAARFHRPDVCKYLVESCEVDVNRPGEDGMTPLHYTARFKVEKDAHVKSEYQQTIQYLITHGANVNARDAFDSTPLHHACERNNVYCAEILLSAGAKIEACDRQKMTPLHRASFYGSADTATLLIENHADLLAVDVTKSIPFAYACRNSHYNILDMFFKKFEQHKSIDDIITAKDADDSTLLHFAVATGNLEMVELLLKKRADTSAKRNDGQAPIHLCIKTDSVEILERLLAEGVNINDVDNGNETVLHKAAANNKANILRCILSKPKIQPDFIHKKNKDDATALLLAATSGHTMCVKVLLEFGADVFNDRDKRERNAVYLASMRNHLETLEALLNHANSLGGSDKEKSAMHAMDRYSRTSLHAAAEFGHVDIVNALLRRNALLTMKDDDEYTPLMLCCRKNRLDVLKAIISYINDNEEISRKKLTILEERDGESNTALHIAAAAGHSSIIQLLLEQNCDLQARNMISWLPIHCAAERGRYNSVKLLIDNRSPIDPLDKNDQTPLHLAALNGHVDIVELLLNNGAKISARTSKCENSLDLAISANRHNVAEFLVKHHDWEQILRNATHDNRTNRWDTPLRKLIRKMPNIAAIVLNKCCTVIRQKQDDNEDEITNENKNESKKKKKKKKKAMSVHENILELQDHQINKNNEANDLISDEKQLQNLKLVYQYEFLDDQFALKKWKEGITEGIYESDGILYPAMGENVIDRKALQENHPFTIMLEYNRDYLLDHPLVHALLDYKWKLLPRYIYYVNFFFYLLFIATLTTYIFLTMAPYQFGITFNQMQESTCYDLCTFIKRNSTEELDNLKGRIIAARVLQWTVIVFAAILIIKELFQVASERLDYINLENIIELSAFILVILFAVDLNSCSREIGYRCILQWQLGALGVFLSWLALVLFIQKFPRFGIFVVMLTHILHTFSRFFLVFFLFIIGFALAFHMLLQNHNSFQHFSSSLLKTGVMMIGEFEYEGIFHGENTNYFGVTYFLFIIFIIVMSIIIMNLLVGLAVDDIAAVMRVATVKRLEMRIKLTLDVERKMPKRKFFSSIRRYRTMTYRSSFMQNIFRKLFHIQIQAQFDKNVSRLQDYGILQTQGSRNKTSTATPGSEISGQSADWITNIHKQINAKTNEFNRHMATLKTQQDKINSILQQLTTSGTIGPNTNLTTEPTAL